MNTEPTQPNAVQREEDADAAHIALRELLLRPILERPDAGSLLDRVAHGVELCIGLDLGTRYFSAALIDDSPLLDSGTLPENDDVLDLIDRLGRAFKSALNAEPVEKRLDLASRARGQPLVALLRVHRTTETLVLRIGPAGAPAIFVVQRVVQFERDKWLAAAPVH